MLFMANNDLVSYGNFLDESEQIMSWMMDEFIHWPKPYRLLSATCDAILSLMIEKGVENHLISGNNSIIPQKICKE